jgi:hypothetical protein
MAGFTARQRLCGAAFTVQRIIAKNTATYTAGDLVNLETGEIDLAATADTNLVGVVLATVSATDSVTKIPVAIDSDIVYGVDDPNARVKGATLDIAGATGAMGVAASSNKELVVHADCTALEETLVRINVGKHHMNKAQ